MRRMHLLMILGCMALFAEGGRAAEAVQDNYAIPLNKSGIEPCQKAALAVRPGQIERFQMKHTEHGIHYLFEIEDEERRLWTVVCDAETRAIISVTGVE